MKWYSKYLPVYEKPFAEVPAETVAEVRVTYFGIISYQVEKTLEFLNLIISNCIFGLVYIN